jgi:CheY-like chemotaxis protein
VETSGRLILIVDDFEANRELYAYILSEKGYQVAVASDGEEAIDKALQLRPHLILMDLSLPVISGAEAARRLKADKSTKHIPVLIVTAYDPRDFSTPEKALDCDGLLMNPCLPDQLIAEVLRFLPAADSTSLPSAQAARTT